MVKNAELHARLLALAGPELEALGLDLVELELLAGGNRLTLRFALERAVEPGADPEERRITLQEIAQASRAVSRAIEAEEAGSGEFMPGRYTIEASSPGIFRRLSKPEHFRRFCGERVRLIAEADEQTREYRGRLVAADDREVQVEDETGGAVTVPLARIQKANLDPELDFGR